LENANRHRDGHIVVMEGGVLLQYRGEFMGYHGTDRDITERKRAEKRWRSDRLLHLKQIQASWRVVSPPASTTSWHQETWNSRLLDLFPASPAWESNKPSMHPPGGRSDTPNLSLHWAGALSGHHINLNDLVRENADLFRAIFTLSQIGCFLNLESINDQADPGQVQQVILNLLTNSVEAMEDLGCQPNHGVIDCDKACEPAALRRPVPGPLPIWKCPTRGAVWMSRL
jgi:hypothetical protein